MAGHLWVVGFFFLKAAGGTRVQAVIHIKYHLRQNKSTMARMASSSKVSIVRWRETYRRPSKTRWEGRLKSGNFLAARLIYMHYWFRQVGTILQRRQSCSNRFCRHTFRPQQEAQASPPPLPAQSPRHQRAFTPVGHALRSR